MTVGNFAGCFAEQPGPSAADTVRALDGGASASPLYGDYARLSPADAWDPDVGYGWVGDVPSSRDRGTPDELRRDFTGTPASTTLRLDVPAGVHTAYLLRGDAGAVKWG